MPIIESASLKLPEASTSEATSILSLSLFSSFSEQNSSSTFLISPLREESTLVGRSREELEGFGLLLDDSLAGLILIFISECLTGSPVVRPPLWPRSASRPDLPLKRKMYLCQDPRINVTYETCGLVALLSSLAGVGVPCRAGGMRETLRLGNCELKTSTKVFDKPLPVRSRNRVVARNSGCARGRQGSYGAFCF
jgi:hypothetical protein